jgi:hypothetical protein
LLVQDALLGVVRKVLMDAAREGTPGDHHFYVTFKTHAPGVQLSARMKAEYPDEITIVLQHQYWDLTVTEQQIEVSLSFKNIPEKLVIPFDAVTGFEDPTAPFGLKFEPRSPRQAKQAPAELSSESQNKPTPITAKSKPQAAAAPSAKQAPKTDKVEKSAADKTSAEQPAEKSAPAEKPAVDAQNDGKIVSIDAFRKKT